MVPPQAPPRPIMQSIAMVRDDALLSVARTTAATEKTIDPASATTAPSHASPSPGRISASAHAEPANGVAVEGDASRPPRKHQVNAIALRAIHRPYAPPDSRPGY